MALISSVFSCFLQTRETRRARPYAAPATKNPARHAARAPSVVSVNIFFWKILVTRVKRKIELPLSPSIGTGSRLTLYLALHRGQSGMQRCYHLRALADGCGDALD